MILLLSGDDGTHIAKRWAKLYGGEPAWNINPDAVKHLLEWEPTHPDFEDTWEVVYTYGNCLLNGTLYRMFMDDGDLFLCEA